MKEFLIVSVEVEVVYGYNAVCDDELSIKVGDVITNVFKFQGGWWEGVLNGDKGFFPGTFVQVCITADSFSLANIFGRYFS